MSVTAQQIEHAWELLDDGAAMDELRRSWDRLVALRRELDEVVVALAQRMEQLRAEIPAEPEDTAREEPEQGESDDG
jgi:hypothetical protein